MSLSSVERHNIQYLHYDDVPASALQAVLDGRPLWMVKGPSHLFRRFKPDNIMHAIHDDVLPLYATLRATYGGRSASERDGRAECVTAAAARGPCAAAAPARAHAHVVPPRSDARLAGEWQKQQLVALDDFAASMPTSPLYAALSVRPLLFLQDLAARRGLVCFE